MLCFREAGTSDASMIVRLRHSIFYKLYCCDFIAVGLILLRNAILDNSSFNTESLSVDFNCSIKSMNQAVAVDFIFRCTLGIIVFGVVRMNFSFYTFADYFGEFC